MLSIAWNLERKHLLLSLFSHENSSNLTDFNKRQKHHLCKKNLEKHLVLVRRFSISSHLIELFNYIIFQDEKHWRSTVVFLCLWEKRFVIYDRHSSPICFITIELWRSYDKKLFTLDQSVRFFVHCVSCICDRWFVWRTIVTYSSIFIKSSNTHRHINEKLLLDNSILL